jgi:hypothetical protein
MALTSIFFILVLLKCTNCDSQEKFNFGLFENFVQNQKIFLDEAKLLKLLTNWRVKLATLKSDIKHGHTGQMA